ncbi:hypothetical protein HYPSUDRAFT_206324 [Hypholoma sublateritium FD-334 SS-4]|uniref:Uncharacterized protein n=1 Tax=Hypholoma sublateritium (strain FD-334 SS-4) TaxID=945553 RepID=A0A0D2NE07_HYPSF|nr:hypothetical protein HYPSUDRAFT_206324 [Hypholoma sublateritium FD-334 SS-4]
MPMIVLVDDQSLPAAPYVGLLPPNNKAKRNSSKFVYGFPLPDEWFRFRYLHDLDISALDEEAIKEKRRLYRGMLLAHLPCVKGHVVTGPVDAVTSPVRGRTQSNLENVVGAEDGNDADVSPASVAPRDGSGSTSEWLRIARAACLEERHQSSQTSRVRTSACEGTQHAAPPRREEAPSRQRWATGGRTGIPAGQ